MKNEPDKLDQQDGMPEFSEKFAAGETSSVEGKPDFGTNRQLIPEKYQNHFRGMCQKVAQRDMFARIEEVRRCAERRFAWRNMLDVVFDEGSAVWTTIGSPSGPTLRNNNDVGDDELHYPFNIFQQFGREHISIVSEPWKIRMEAVKTDALDALRISSSADAIREKIEDSNNPKNLRTDASRLAWTDGRTSFYTRWVTDGAKFGYEDADHDSEDEEGLGAGGDPPTKKPRNPKGGTVITAYGVLECKVPINMRESSEFMWRQLSYEIDLTSAKSMYPWLASDLQGGEPGPGEYNFDRTTRLATTQGIRLITESGDTTRELPTWQRTWFRPSFYSSIEQEEDRAWFEDNYPDGAYVAFIGNTYCESRNESMDDHWVDVHPLPGDGQATPACGEIIMPVQYAVLDMVDLAMETFMKGIPAIWCDPGMVDTQAISKQKAGPGAHYKGKRDLESGEKMADGFWAEPIPDLSQSALAFMQQIFTDVPQSLTGLSAAALGMADPSNQTKGGIQLLQAASKGQSGIAWSAFREGYANSMEQAVRIEAYFRTSEAEDGILKIGDVEVELEDLHPGNWACVPDGDESYPNTHAEKREALIEFVNLAGKSPDGMKLLFLPKNMALMKDLIGLQELEVPAADSEENELAEIKQLLSESPVPNMQAKQRYMAQALAAQAQGQPMPPQPPPEAMLNPSVPIDQIFDNHQERWQADLDFANSPKGQEAKRTNKEGWMNFTLHAQQHKKLADQEQQQAAQQALAPQVQLEQAKHAGQAKSPSESIQFKDLGPSGQLQLAKQAGLDISADVGADMAEDHMQPTNSQPEKTAKPQ